MPRQSSRNGNDLRSFLRSWRHAALRVLVDLTLRELVSVSSVVNAEKIETDLVVLQTIQDRLEYAWIFAAFQA
jgi:hypothetical protein